MASGNRGAWLHWLAEHMDFSGCNPLKITWENRGDDFFVPVKANEASITVMCHKNFH